MLWVDILYLNLPRPYILLLCGEWPLNRPRGQWKSARLLLELCRGGRRPSLEFVTEEHWPPRAKTYLPRDVMATDWSSVIVCGSRGISTCPTVCTTSRVPLRIRPSRWPILLLFFPPFFRLHAPPSRQTRVPRSRRHRRRHVTVYRLPVPPTTQTRSLWSPACNIIVCSVCLYRRR